VQRGGVKGETFGRTAGPSPQQRKEEKEKYFECWGKKAGEKELEFPYGFAQSCVEVYIDNKGGDTLRKKIQSWVKFSEDQKQPILAFSEKQSLSMCGWGEKGIQPRATAMKSSG